VPEKIALLIMSTAVQMQATITTHFIRYCWIAEKKVRV
jgi:hypothetical protein